VVVLGIETSCDDTSAAVYSTEKGLISSVISSQMEHAEFGGVVPEIASRAHLSLLLPVVEKALEHAETPLSGIEGIAVTYAPGLVGSLLVGVSFTKALSLSGNIPFIGVHHIEGHIQSNFLTDPVPEYPAIVLVVSGGHTEIILMKKPMEYLLLGKTRDDAAGEAFDKVSKLIGLGYPGGPLIEKNALGGDENFVTFPVSKVPDYEFSFSGLKTAVLTYVKDKGEDFVMKNLKDILASFQKAVVDALVTKTLMAVKEHGVSNVMLAGGVAANKALRLKLESESCKEGFRMYAPPMKYCTDNAAMIAKAGHDRLLSGMRSPLTLTPVPNLPLY